MDKRRPEGDGPAGFITLQDSDIRVSLHIFINVTEGLRCFLYISRGHSKPDDDTAVNGYRVWREAVAAASAFSALFLRFETTPFHQGSAVSAVVAAGVAGFDGPVGGAGFSVVAVAGTRSERDDLLSHR
jgi:hypothetical protein